jgi:hypothetical protein
MDEGRMSPGTYAGGFHKGVGFGSQRNTSLSTMARLLKKAPEAEGVIEEATMSNICGLLKKAAEVVRVTEEDLSGMVRLLKNAPKHKRMEKAYEVLQIMRAAEFHAMSRELARQKTESAEKKEKKKRRPDS